MASSLAFTKQSDIDSKVNILLVDDQPGKLLSYKAVLAELGENLVSAVSGREALEHLLKADFAVILVDVCMPEQDGFELVETIRSHHRFSKTAIIFVSAIQMTDFDRIRGYASGAVDYVSVPIVPEILRAKVAVFVELYRKTRQLEQLNAELEARVLERTAKLNETQEALTEADHRKDMFLATLAHELRNPLAPMRSSLDILNLSKNQDPMGAMALDVMERQLTQLTRLVDDLMDLGRITRNSIEMRRSAVELSQIIVSALEVANPNIVAAGQTLVCNTLGHSAILNVDGIRISQVIANLLNNASKYTPSGGTICLQLEQTGHDLHITVRDDGIGLEADDIPRIFEPFFQVEQINDRPKSGLGIGLNLVRAIVERHGGTVTAHSGGPGMGSEFKVKLPGAIGTLLEPSDVVGKSSANRKPGSGHRILVADDSIDAAQTLGALLGQMGNEIELVHDGEEAIRKAEEFRPDLIILDIGMPKQDGYQVAKEIRSRPWGQTPVIVAVTGWGQQQDREKTTEGGFNHHFVKPVDMKTLRGLLLDLGRKQRE